MGDKPRYFVPELHEVLWRNAATLGETVVKYVMEKKTNTPEFQALIKFHGREKLLKLYEDEKRKREEEKK